jgi:cysteinyl-tRNA synthetase
MLKLHNTLTGKTEEFISIEPNKVGMYNCGPTVYNHAHIGNLRAYVFADILRRTLELEGLAVKQVINITDVGHLTSDADSGDDKMTKALIREGKPLTRGAMREVAYRYFEYFKEDLIKLNIKAPSEFPFASDNITEDIEMIEMLFEKGIAYKTSDGVYFDIAKFPAYGKLGNIKQEEESEAVARVEANPEKKNYRDFALWKFDEKGWETPFGTGFPGWHIECSAMAKKYLGDTFDIHTGGIDHIPTHHNNEIAQSESANEKPLARFWLHSAHVQIDGSKMAKSEENFITLNTLVEKGFLPLSYRYWLLQARYSTQVNFTWDALLSAQIGYMNLIKQVQSFEKGGEIDESYRNQFIDSIEDDLNTSFAIALIWILLKDNEVPEKNKRATVVMFDAVLGLNLEHAVIPEIHIDASSLPVEIRELIDTRETARRNKDFMKSDELRNELKEKGYMVEDKPEGPQISRL